jgi:diguanylate cyclase (GGDEF)-like protein
MKRSKAVKAPRTLAALARENATLRRELAKLEVFRQLAYRDPLTGLWNRRYLDERLAEELGRAARATDRTFSVVVVDVNDFKRVNDRYGHAAGDRALVWVAELLRRAVRAHDLCCRTGGDEFTLLFPDVPHQTGEALVQRLRHAVAAANEGRRLRLTLAFGVASYPDDATGAEELVALADEAMYRDKRRQKLDDVHTPPPVVTSALTLDS